MLNMYFIFESILNSWNGEYDLTDKIEIIQFKKMHHDV